MNLCGEIVHHKTFGTGKISAFDGKHVTVIFNNIQKVFLYPNAFGIFLTLDNKELMAKIKDEQTELEKELNEKKEIQLRKIQNDLQKNPGSKTISSSGSKKGLADNIAFKCNYCDGRADKNTIGFKGLCSKKMIHYNICEAKHVWCSGEESLCNKYLNEEVNYEELAQQCCDGEFVCYESQMLKEWKAFAGIIQTGVNKGKPMTLRNVGTNSLAVLTTRFPNKTDYERFIFAVFLVNRNYEGDDFEEGYVAAESKYRIEMTPSEAQQMKFWNYYFNQKSPQVIKFGSGLHRYLTDIQSAQILRDICKIKEGTQDEEISREFYNYFVELKGIDKDTLPLPNGGLARILDI